MSFWKRLSRKKLLNPREIMSKEEYKRIMLQIVNARSREEHILTIVDEAIGRFELHTIDSNLDEAKRIQGPVSICVDVSPFLEPGMAIWGGKDVKDRLFRLIVAERNLYFFSEFHRQAGDALYNLGKLREALDHYNTVLRFRPRYSYILSGGECITPPELEGFAWPQIHDRKSGTKQNIRTKSASIHLQKDAGIMSFFYSRLGRCLSKVRQNYKKANEAFDISFWFLAKLKPNAKQKMAYTVHNERGACLLEQGDYEGAITHFEKVRSLCSVFPSELGLAECLINLGESCLKAGQTGAAHDNLSKALKISKQTKKQEFIRRIEKLLSKMD